MAETPTPDAAKHGKDRLLASYNRQCPGCRQAVSQLSEPQARRWLSAEAARTRYRRTRLQNAIAIWQSAAKRVRTRKAQS